ncbi:MFS transporter [Bacillus sp. NPDC077027]|uniref:MFS transporter n=1 Tax=Bacillus sp. NPDC077027 TaxID=3390548 RepID=UPI003D086F8A
MEHVQVKTNKRSMYLFIFLGMGLLITTTGFGRLAYGVVLPFMQADLSFTTTEAGMLGTYLFLGYLVTVGLSGILTKKLGPKLTVLIGNMSVFIGLSCLIFVNSYGFAVVSVFLLGLGSALVFTPLMSLVIIFFPQHRGTVMGFLMSGAGIGMLLSGFIVPLIMHVFPVEAWRHVWGIFAFLTLVFLLFTFFFLKDAPNRTTSVQHEVSNQAWRSPSLYLLGIIYFLIGFVYLIPTLYQTSYLIDLGVSESLAGSIYSFAGFVSIFGPPLWGWIADRIGIKKALITVITLSAFGNIIPVILTDTVFFTFSSFFWGTSLGGTLVLIQLQVAKLVKPQYVPLAISFISIFYGIGQMAGPGVSGFLIDYFDTYRAAYLFGTGGFITCTLLSFFLPSTRLKSLR